MIDANSMEFSSIVDSGSSNLDTSASFFGEKDDGARGCQDDASEGIDGSPRGDRVCRCHFQAAIVGSSLMCLIDW